MSVSFKALGQYGRLGNSLFELSATIALALDNNDTYLFPPWQYEQFFNLHGCFSNKIININNTYTEPHFHYAPIPYKPNLNLIGYFQSYLYFQNWEPFIRQLFTPIHQIEPQEGITSIHIRRTDYLKFANHHTNLTMDYYNQAMELCQSDRYFIFSDDPQWCKENFKGDKFKIIEGNHETFDLGLMARCEKNIIANSSFSWWGAYLNKNSKMVIAPKNWFGTQLPHNIKDLLPGHWIKV